MTKEQLKDILTLNERINSKQRQIDELRRTAQSVQGIDYAKDRVQTSVSSAIENICMKIADMEIEIAKDIDELVDMKMQAKRVIDRLEGKYSLLMNLRYMECLDWNRVANIMKYSIDSVFRIHGEALEKLKNESQQ